MNVAKLEQETERARSGSGEEVAELVYHQAPEVLLSLLQNPNLDERNYVSCCHEKIYLRNCWLKLAHGRAC